MPELPEVETIRRGLVDRIREARIQEILARPCRVFRMEPAALEVLRDQTIEDLKRRGKFLVLSTQDHFCIFHLGMTGQLTLRHPDRPDGGFVRHAATGLQRASQHSPDQHTHFEIHLDDGRQILYRDVRKFGRIHLLDRNDDLLEEFFGRLGLEPFSDDYRKDSFLRLFEGRRLSIKALLLDQTFVAGIGNIYADEALFEARVHPLTPSDHLTRSQKTRLFEAIPLVLKKGIQFGGTSLRDYVDSEGRSGTHQDELQVYGRKGLACPRCGASIRKIVVAQRGTHFCARCQRRRTSRRKPGP